jgi:hypothetical protein
MSNKFEDLLETMEWFGSDDATGQAMLYVIETRVKDIELAHAETHGNYLPAPNSPEAKRIAEVAHKAKMTAVYGHLREFEKKLEAPESKELDSDVLDARSADEILYDVLTLRQLLEEFKLGSDINREKSRVQPIDFFHAQIDLIAAKQFRQSGVNDARIIEYLVWNPLSTENRGKIHTSRQSHDLGL